MVVPQKDMEPRQVNSPSLEKKVLIASRNSEFKNAVVDKIIESLKDETVYIKVTGLGDLKEEKAEKFSAIVLINTCMSWDMDRNVNSFLKKHKDQSRVIVLTTSGDGDWKPKMKGRNFDAISSASKKPKADEVANKILGKVRLLIA
jgi:hypothetical protein